MKDTLIKALQSEELEKPFAVIDIEGGIIRKISTDNANMQFFIIDHDNAAIGEDAISMTEWPETQVDTQEILETLEKLDETD